MTNILNPYVDVVKSRRQYRDFNWSRLEDIFNASFAEKVIQDLVRNTEFENVFFIDGEQFAMTDAQLAGLPESNRNQLVKQIHDSASNGEGYLYSKRTVINDSSANACSEVLKWLNSDETIELVTDITGLSDLSYALCDGVRFSKGQFLTDKANRITSKFEKIGFMLDFTPDWNINWGGLLHLHSVYEDSGVTFTPVFNNMILFDASFDYSVTYLANYIKYNRYSLMGSFCKDL